MLETCSLRLPTVQTYVTAGEFLAQMEARLVAEEACNGLMLGLALTLVDSPHFYGADAPYFATATDVHGIAAAALMTPPHNVALYGATEAAVRPDLRPALAAIARDLLSSGRPLPGVTGPEDVAAAFSAIWRELTGAAAAVALAERVYELRTVDQPVYSPGQMRQARTTDGDLLARWLVDFVAEALAGVDTMDLDAARRRVQVGLDRGSLYVWEDGAPVALAGWTRPTRHGVAVGPVYTPPDRRGRGYATSLVAALSQRLLDEGRAFCTLFTNLANPTSNRIYQRIGYRPVCDYTVYRFDGN
jgi:hypothetical protein